MSGAGTATIAITATRSSSSLVAAARSRLYRELGDAVRFPTPELHRRLATGELSRELARLAGVLPHELAVPDDLTPSDELADFRAESIRLFDVGRGGRPPCTLYEGEQRSATRMQVMEEVVRFYEHFGLALSGSPRELPDHLTVELEFLHYLSFKAAAALERGVDPAPYLRAARDFLERHLCRWIPSLGAELERAGARRPYPALFGLLAAFLRSDLDHLRAATAAG